MTSIVINLNVKNINFYLINPNTDVNISIPNEIQHITLIYLPIEQSLL